MARDDQQPDQLLLQVIVPRPPPSSSSVEENQESNSNMDIDLNPEGCRTPTSHAHKIPAIVNCPPAPKKRGMLKRKLRDPPFFEFTAGDEVDALFISSFELFRVSSGSVKWRRYNWSESNKSLTFSFFPFSLSFFLYIYIYIDIYNHCLLKTYPWWSLWDIQYDHGDVAELPNELWL